MWRKKHTNFNDPIIVVSWHLARFKKISIQTLSPLPIIEISNNILNVPCCRRWEIYVYFLRIRWEWERKKGTTAVSRKHQRLFCLYNHHSVGLWLASAQLKIILKVSRVSFSLTRRPPLRVWYYFVNFIIPKRRRRQREFSLLSKVTMFPFRYRLCFFFSLELHTAAAAKRMLLLRAIARDEVDDWVLECSVKL